MKARAEDPCMVAVYAAVTEVTGKNCYRRTRWKPADQVVPDRSPGSAV